MTFSLVLWQGDDAMMLCVWQLFDGTSLFVRRARVGPSQPFYFFTFVKSEAANEHEAT